MAQVQHHWPQGRRHQHHQQAGQILAKCWSLGKTWGACTLQTTQCYNVQVRALAYQIHCFLETAYNPSFLRNQYHEVLYQYHVLGDDIPEPDLHPCFKGEFFPTIRRINSSPLGLSKLSVKEIYRFLIEEITMIDDNSGSHTLKPLRVELSNPLNQWETTWSLSRQYMLGPNLYTFLFKLLHRILPIAERVARILPNQSPICNRCVEGTAETLEHAFFHCQQNKGAGNVLLIGLRKCIPGLTPSKILILDFDIEETYISP